VESGHAVPAIAPVVSAGVGIRYPSGWALRLASFRLDHSEIGGPALGIVTPRSTASYAIIDLLSGRVAPSYGTLHVLGQDLTTAAGRAAVRRQTGTASRASRPMPGIRIRRLVERAARQSGQPGSDRGLLVAAILDRLSLTAWSEVPLSAAPELIARKARLAAACVHQPKLLIIDGLLDHLQPRDLTVLADVIRDARRDTALVALGVSADALALVCEQVADLSDGVIMALPASRTPDDPTSGQTGGYAATSGHGGPGHRVSGA
jgi:ABC-type multidrug transport system ATPase subunit